MGKAGDSSVVREWSADHGWFEPGKQKTETLVAEVPQCQIVHWPNPHPLHAPEDYKENTTQLTMVGSSHARKRPRRS